MPRKRKSPTAELKCGICTETMQLMRIIPAAHIFPELKTFQCVGCGNLRSIESEAELAAELTQAAA